MKNIVFVLILVTSASQAQIAKDKCRFLGNIISDHTPSDFTTLWNQVTPENAGKWGSVEASKDIMVWTDLDNAYKTAKDNGLPFKQHNFVWGQQQPSWVGALSAEDQAKQVEEWIKSFCERYPETDYIDVVNEPLHETPVYSNAIGGKGTTGWDWVIWAFEKAKQYCPNAKRILNDYNIVNDNVATLKYIELINILKNRQLLDYIGEQGHNFETTPVAAISSNMDKLAATGLPILISELDLNIAADADQKAKYESLFPVLWNHNAVHGITLWGYRQGEIWSTNAYLVRTNGTSRPALDWMKTYVAGNLGGAFCITTGLEEENKESKVYPNPSEGKVQIDYDVFEIKDVTNRTVLKGAGPTTINLPQGIYIINNSYKLLIK
ncbi:MAG: endo-1,4-beta-xylanase [Bacteroidota bacterium]